MKGAQYTTHPDQCGHLLKIAGFKLPKWLNRSKKGIQKSQIGSPAKTKPGKSSKRVGWKAKTLGVGTIFAGGAYADQAMKLRGRADNPYKSYE